MTRKTSGIPIRTILPQTVHIGSRTRWFLLVLVMNILILAYLLPVFAQGNDGDAVSLTQELIAQSVHYRQTGVGDKKYLMKSIINTATSRKQLLLLLVEENPAEVLRLSLTESMRSGLPPEVQMLLEKELDIEGDIEVLHEDRDTGSSYSYSLKAGGKRYSLYFTGHQPTEILTGTRIHVRGIQLDTKLVVGDDITSLQPLALAPVPNALGEQRTLVILVKFQDTPTEPYSFADAQNVIFGTTSDYFRENSYQQTWLSGDIFGWYTIPLNSSTCDTASIKAYAEAAATADGVDLTAYAHYVYAFPFNSVCGFAGRSTVGGSPSLAWINGKPELGVTAHELGHGLGLWHSHSLDCGSSAIIGPSCTIIEYGDILDMMGASRSAQLNAFQKERLGWLNSGNSPAITTVQSPGTYTLTPYELGGTGPKALKVLKSIDLATGRKNWYYVEARQPIGFDAFLSGTDINVINGLLVHTATEGDGNTSALLDMTPATPTHYWWYDPAITVGQTFSDPEAGITITLNSAGETGAVISVGVLSSFNMTLAPDKATYSPGQTVTITATVRQGSAPVSKAGISLRVIKPNGSSVVYTGTTVSNGSAIFKHRLGRKDPVGYYQTSAMATKGTTSTTVTAGFTVK